MIKGFERFSVEVQKQSLIDLIEKMTPDNAYEFEQDIRWHLRELTSRLQDEEEE